MVNLLRNGVRVLLVFLVVGVFSSEALAGSYTINTTAAQDVKLNHIATKLGLTPEQVIRQSAIAYINGMNKTMNIQQRRNLLDKLDAGTLPAQVQSDLNQILSDHGDD